MSEATKWLGKTEPVAFTQEEYDIFRVADEVSRERTFKVLLVGPSGAGKTDRPRAFASENNRPFSVSIMSLIRDPEEVFGSRELVATPDGPKTEYVLNEMALTLMGGNGVVVLDEINRVEPWVLNALMPILDHRQKTVVRGHEIAVATGTIIVATANVGWEYTGTFKLDQALANRFDIVWRVGYPGLGIERQILTRRVPGLGEETAQNIAQFMHNLRQSETAKLVSEGVLSTRTALIIAEIVVFSDVSPAQAARYVILNRVDQALTRDIVDIINDTLGLE